MIEKTFDKMYPLDAPKSTLTRVANRMLKEYKQAFDGYAVPDEITTLCNIIKRGEETVEHEYEYNNTLGNTALDSRDYDECKVSTEERVHAFYDEDEYGEPMYHVTWYFYSSEWYTKRIRGDQNCVKVGAGTMIEITRKAYAAKGKYRYFCTHRPPSCGCIPSGFVSYDAYRDGSRYCGEVTYNEKPADDELRRWGLEYDKEYERVRAIWLEEDNA